MTNPFLFKGELGRRGFFWSYLVNLIALIVALYFLFWLDEPIGVILFSILTIIRCWFNFSFRARRCHDLGWSGWWQFVPLMDFLLAILEKGQRKLRNVYASITISVFALMFGFNLMDDYRYRKGETFMTRSEWEQSAESYSQLIEDNAELNVSVAYPNTYYYRKTSCSVEGTKTVDAAYDPDNERLYLYIKSEAEAY